MLLCFFMLFILPMFPLSELKAEASLMDQMSSGDSSSDSTSASSSSSEDSSSDSEDDDRSSPSGPGTYSSGHSSMSARPQYRTPDTDASRNRFHDNSGLLMSTLRKYTWPRVTKTGFAV